MIELLSNFWVHLVIKLLVAALIIPLVGLVVGFEGLNRIVPDSRPRAPTAAARRGSATAGVKPPASSDGADFFLAGRLSVVAARAGASTSDSATSTAAPVDAIPPCFMFYPTPTHSM